MKYHLIDDPICDLNEEEVYENCEDCPHFYECMEVEEEGKKND